MQEILINSRSGEITINFEEMQAALKEAVAGYKTAVYTDETIQDAKKDRAYLRKQADEIDKKRKAIKKEFMLPYDEFEKKCKQLVALIDEGTQNIDSQVKAYEENLRAEKRELIKEAYLEIVSEDMRDILTLERMYKSSWENQTTTMKSVKEDMVEKQSAVFTDLACINNSIAPDDDKAEALKVYKTTLQLAVAMSKLQEMSAIRARVIEEERKKQEAEKIAAVRAEEEAKWTAMNPPVPEEPVEAPTVPSEDGFGAWVMDEVSYKVSGTDEDYSALERFMTERGMVWQRI